MQTEKSPPYFERILSAHIFCSAKKRTFFCYSIFSKLKQKQERMREKKHDSNERSPHFHILFSSWLLSSFDEVLFSLIIFRVFCSRLMIESLFFFYSSYQKPMRLLKLFDCIANDPSRTELSRAEPSRIA